MEHRAYRHLTRAMTLLDFGVDEKGAATPERTRKTIKRTRPKVATCNNRMFSPQNGPTCWMHAVALIVFKHLRGDTNLSRRFAPKMHEQYAKVFTQEQGAEQLLVCGSIWNNMDKRVKEVYAILNRVKDEEMKLLETGKLGGSILALLFALLLVRMNAGIKQVGDMPESIWLIKWTKGSIFASEYVYHTSLHTPKHSAFKRTTRRVLFTDAIDILEDENLRSRYTIVKADYVIPAGTKKCPLTTELLAEICLDRKDQNVKTLIERAGVASRLCGGVLSIDAKQEYETRCAGHSMSFMICNGKIILCDPNWQQCQMDTTDLMEIAERKYYKKLIDQSKRGGKVRMDFFFIIAPVTVPLDAEMRLNARPVPA